MVKINSNAIPASTLPKGWQIIHTTRTGGKTVGKVDKHYLSPSLKHFRSLCSARAFIKNLSESVADPAPQPVAPAPVVQAPAPVVQAPAPVVQAPAPVAPLPNFDENGNEVITIYDSSDDESEWL